MVKNTRWSKLTASVLSAFVLVLFCTCTVFSSEEEYPVKPVTLYVPYGPGGSTDLAARVLSSVIPQYLGQPVIVVNKPGAGGAICFEFVKNQRPDGYSIMMTAIGANVITPALQEKLPFKYDDLTYIARTQINPTLLAVRSDAPWKNMKELIAFIKNNPKKVKFSVSGLGTLLYVGPAVLMQAAGLPGDSITPIQYDSGAEATLALLRGDVDFIYVNLPPLLGHLRAGKLRGLATATPKRLKAFPDVPTFAELGFPDVDVLGWRGVAGPPKLPGYIVKKWEDAVKKTTKDKAWLKLVNKLGDMPGFLGQKDYEEFVNKDYKRFRTTFEKLGIVVKK
jgi:tripartite-type tricarboxylate transporter receptor subunit TctC